MFNVHRAPYTITTSICNLDYCKTVPEQFVYVMLDGRGAGDDTRLVRQLVLSTWDVNYGHRAPGDHETLSTLS